MGNVMTRDRAFKAIDGNDLRNRWDRAISAAASQSPFWIAYSFNVRHGVSVELMPEAGFENRNLGLFFLLDCATEAVKKLEIRNLDRQNEYGHPVYWLGCATVHESLELLSSLCVRTRGKLVQSRLIEAISMHKGPLADQALETLRRQAATAGEKSLTDYWLRERATALRPFKNLPESIESLAEIVRNDAEDRATRRNAAQALGVMADPAGIKTLAALYRGESERDLKNWILGAAINKANSDVINLFLDVAANDRDKQLRQQAYGWLAEKTANRIAWNLKPGLRLFPNDEISEQDRKRLDEISRREGDGAVDALIEIARNNPAIGIRKAAAARLGRIGGQRVLAFYRDILLKEVMGVRPRFSEDR
jgi:hypothetical protein